MPFLVLAAILLAIWSPWQEGAAGGGQPMDIARRRLASGEINHEEFERLKQQLGVSQGWRGSSPALLLALLSVLLLVALGSTVAWAWQSGDWNWGWGPMGGPMMGGGRNTSAETPRQGGTATTVVIADYAYSPGNLEVPLGANVTWTNRDGARHSATADDRSWDTGLLAQGASETIAFDTPGTFDYFCTLHPAMKARLVVR
ncbi:MAG: cupredoxin domain-containing protein [Dehalococcoidia bacterium]